MKINKWNYKTKKYDIVELPNLKYKVYSNDMDEIVNCPHCLKEVAFGKCYTSLEFHTEQLGFGYSVCERCYEKECEDRRESEVKEYENS